MNGREQTAKTGRQPFFYDVTLRDGNQALRHPWDLHEKERVFRQLLKLGAQGIEVGYAGASEMDFVAVEHLAKMGPENVVISSLARTVPRDIERAWEAVKHAPNPRIHTFITTSEYNMEHVLRMTPDQVQKRAVDSVALIKKLMNGRGSIQFSAEHFGDCVDNMDFVIETFQAVIAAGATVINLPNTVERYRPMVFVDMVNQVVAALPKHITIAVHTHNDLGMATATTVESFFAGATQLECALNGLGERAGNTNMYEVAVSLHNCGIDTGLNMEEIYETALLISEWSRVPIYEKAPLVGSDVVAHRSGIHQDGAAKTKGMKKGAYRAFEADLIGRKESDKLVFTSQSGKAAVHEIIQGLGLPITVEEAAQLQPVLKKISEEKQGELADADLVRAYDEVLLATTGALEFKALRVTPDEMNPEEKQFSFDVRWKGKEQTLIGRGTGPVDACMHAVESIGLYFHLIEYAQHAVDIEHLDFAAYALSEIKLQRKSGSGNPPEGPVAIGRGKDKDTIKANVKALFNGMNRLIG
ncbi:MAG TPA: 2-isopropylmalate synthase [Fibrobacteres bacterium]|jgi:2-isopropylmalate synthase|nr:2-isopropylmalate synthase [Fibrobacterota bacterium]